MHFSAEPTLVHVFGTPKATVRYSESNKQKTSDGSPDYFRGVLIEACSPKQAEGTVYEPMIGFGLL